MRWLNIDKFEQFCVDSGISFYKNEPLSKHCTFKIGGPASLFIEPDSRETLRKVILEANRYNVRLFILGNGSNVLFPDKGFNGAVLRIGAGFSSMRLVDGLTIECDSGVPLKSLCEFACENSLGGLEFAYGIPGSVGGAVYMNAGAYGGEMKDVVSGTYHITQDGEMGSFTGGELEFGYRHSVYSGTGLVIIKALFGLNYRDRREIRAQMEDYMSRRHEKQPLDYKSAGSTFKRPAGGYASELIDRCGLKGMRIGGAMVSDKHAGFVVNTGDATCKDVLNLIGLIQKTVKEKTGFELEAEIKVIE